MKTKCTIAVIICVLALMNSACKKKKDPVTNDPPTPKLTLSASTATVSSNIGYFKLRVETNTLWDIRCDANWCQFKTVAEGEGYEDIEIEFMANNEKTTRLATIVARGLNVSPVTFVLTQDRRPPANQPNYLPVSNLFGTKFSGIDLDFFDRDNDGDLDAYAFSGAIGSVERIENEGTASNPKFISPSGWGLILDQIANIDFVDLDKDGDKDILGMYDNAKVAYMKNTGTAADPVFSTPVYNPFSITALIVDVNCADIDKDGDQDIFGLASNGQLQLFKNLGTPTNPNFADPQNNPFGITMTLIDVAIGDLDDDDDLDILALSSTGKVFFFQNTGTVSAAIFGAPVADPFGLTLTATRLTIADIDDDRDNDVFATTTFDGPVLFLKNTNL